MRIPQTVWLTPATSGHLDAARAVAALVVVIGHWRGFYFVDYGHISPGHITPLVKTVYAVTGFGHQAVMVFFVLSGFLISASILRNLERNTWSWPDYAVDRLARLYVVLIPGLLLGAGWDALGIEFFNSGGIYSAPLVPFGTQVPADNLSPSTFVGNLLFLQTRFTSVWGSNGPLWSLFNEFWYYVLFPSILLAFLYAQRRALLPAAGSVLVAALTVWILGSAIVGFAVWLAGFAVTLTAHHWRFAKDNGLGRSLYLLCTATFFLFCLVASRSTTRWLGSDLAVGLSFAALLHGLLQLHVQLGVLGLRLAKIFAGFSYTLYAVHFPFLFFIRAKWLADVKWQPDVRHLAYGSSIIVVVVAYAFAVARLTEWNTIAVREWVRRRVLGGTRHARSTL